MKSLLGKELSTQERKEVMKVKENISVSLYLCVKFQASIQQVFDHIPTVSDSVQTLFAEIFDKLTPEIVSLIEEKRMFCDLSFEKWEPTIGDDDDEIPDYGFLTDEDAQELGEQFPDEGDDDEPEGELL